MIKFGMPVWGRNKIRSKSYAKTNDAKATSLTTGSASPCNCASCAIPVVCWLRESVTPRESAHRSRHRQLPARSDLADGVGQLRISSAPPLSRPRRDPNDCQPTEGRKRTNDYRVTSSARRMSISRGAISRISVRWMAVSRSRMAWALSVNATVWRRRSAESTLRVT